MTSLTFLGAAGTVTGSRHLLERPRTKVLLGIAAAFAATNTVAGPTDAIDITPEDAAAVTEVLAHRR